MRYQTPSGVVFEANNAEEVVRQLHELSFAPAEDDAAWMQECAKRTNQVNQKIIRWDTAAHFVADLIEAELLQPEERVK